MHHSEDVIMGSILGIVCAYIILYREEHSDQKQDKQMDIRLKELSPEKGAMIVK